MIAPSKGGIRLDCGKVKMDVRDFCLNRSCPAVPWVSVKVDAE